MLTSNLFRNEYDSQKSDSGSSDSLDSLFDDKDASSAPEISSFIQPKEVFCENFCYFIFLNVSFMYPKDPIGG